MSKMRLLTQNFGILASDAILPPEGFMQNGKIVPSVASGNLTVALKATNTGLDATPTNPIYVMIGGVVRTITSALSVSANAGTNWFNAGSSELATKEIDYFSFIGYNSSSSLCKIMFGRRATDGQKNITGYIDSPTGVEENYLRTYSDIGTNDTIVNIGRFAATLSAGAGYTWSIPATSVIVNRPIYETRDPITSNWTPTLTWTGTTAPTGGTNLTYNYQIIGSKCYIRGSGYNMTAGLNNTRLVVSLPFGAIGTAANIALIPAQVSSHNVPNTCYGDINYNDAKLTIIFSTANVEYFNFQGYYNI